MTDLRVQYGVAPYLQWYGVIGNTFNIYRSTEQGSGTLINSTTNLFYQDDSASQGFNVQYYYYVVAINIYGEGPPSTEQSITYTGYQIITDLITFALIGLIVIVIIISLVIIRKKHNKSISNKVPLVS